MKHGALTKQLSNVWLLGAKTLMRKSMKEQMKEVIADFKMNKKGLGLGDVPTVMLNLAFIVVISIAVYLILGGMDTSITGITATANASHSAVNNFTAAMNSIVGFAPTWGVIIGVAVLIGIVLTAFYFGKKGLGGGE